MNHRRRSPRSEVSQEAIDLLSVLIQKPEFPIPGQTAYRCDVFEPGGRCPCFQVLDADGVSLVTFGVGLGVDCSQGLWIALHARADFLNLKIETQLESPPRTLWLGVLLEPALLTGSPGDGVAGRFCKMPLVVGAGPEYPSFPSRRGPPQPDKVSSYRALKRHPKTASAADARFTHVAALSFLSSSTPYKVLTRKKVARPPSPSRKPKRW